MNNDEIFVFTDGFLSFLPQDNDEVKTSALTEALEAINEDLKLMLNLSDQDFWDIVKDMPSFTSSIDSFLRFKIRSFDINKKATALSIIDEEVSKNYLLIILRLVSVSETTRQVKKRNRAKFLYDNWILDIPKLFDICSIYGIDNPDVTELVLKKAFDLQPKYLEDLENTLYTIEDNLYHFNERATDSLINIKKGEEISLMGWPDGFDYLIDVSVTLSLFLDCYNEAGFIFIRKKEGLLPLFSQMHDILLPQFSNALREFKLEQQIISSVNFNKYDYLLRKVHIVMAAMEKICFLILKYAFLTEFYNSKKPKEKVSNEKGEGFMENIMKIAQLDEKDASNTMLHKINQRFNLGDLVVNSVENGIISMDDAQFDYFRMIVGTRKRPNQLQHINKTDNYTEQIKTSDNNGIEVSANSSSLLGKLQSQVQEEEAILMSKIAQIKEVLPDHGDGFLAACLKEYRNNPEKVIHQLLEGKLPSSLSKLDPFMPMNTKHILVDSPETKLIPISSHFNQNKPSSSNDPNSSVSLQQSFYSQFLLPDDIGPGWNSENKVEANFSDFKKWNDTRTDHSKKKKMPGSTLKVLGKVDEEIRSLVIRQANELLADEYEDEYDDSFDDLGLSVNDFEIDAEGDIVDDDEVKEMKSSSNENQSKKWVLNDKIYNYKKEGATEVIGQENALKQVVKNKEEIHGLGRGGNLPMDKDGNIEEVTPLPKENQNYRPKKGHKGKERYKAAIGNHHRKEKNKKKYSDYY